jgi:hypothetical protein
MASAASSNLSIRPHQEKSIQIFRKRNQSQHFIAKPGENAALRPAEIVAPK